MGYFFIFIPFFQLYKYLGVLVKHSFIILTLGLLITTLSGCVTSRGLIQVPTPHNPTSYQEAANSKKVVIALVEDDRTFEDKPATADIPSLKDGLAKATEADKAKAVARKRNGYGKALGDILLEKETVSELLQKRTTLALERSGYVVLENNATNRANADFVLNIKINKFWSGPPPRTYKPVEPSRPFCIPGNSCRVFNTSFSPRYAGTAFTCVTGNDIRLI